LSSLAGIDRSGKVYSEHAGLGYPRRSSRGRGTNELKQFPTAYEPFVVVRGTKQVSSVQALGASLARHGDDAEREAKINGHSGRKRQ
jgi:hypothetical protein